MMMSIAVSSQIFFHGERVQYKYTKNNSTIYMYMWHITYKRNICIYTHVRICVVEIQQILVMSNNNDFLVINIKYLYVIENNNICVASYI